VGENLGGDGTARKLVERTLAVDHTIKFLLMHAFAVSAPELWFIDVCISILKC